MQLLNIVIGILLARLLTATDYGLMGMLAVFTAIAGALQESGFTTALANMERPTDNDYNSVFWFSAIMGWISYIVLFLFSPSDCCFLSSFRAYQSIPFRICITALLFIRYSSISLSI